MNETKGPKKRGRPPKLKPGETRPKRLPTGTILVSSNARTWHEPTNPPEPIRYCKLKNGTYRRMHQIPGSTGSTPVTKAHIDHMAKERTYR